MEKISVIIPTHNRENLLPRAIKSVQNQTFPVYEIIIVADGCTDHTASLVENMQKEDKRIKLIAYYPGHNGNYARNKGIDAASGDYIAFLDDDDEWLPEKTERQMKLFKEDLACGLVYSAQNCIYQEKNIQYVTKPSWEGDLSKRIFIHNDIGTPSQVILKRSVLNRVGKFDLALRALQDYDLWIRCCQETKVRVVREPCINYYNASSNNQVSSNTEKYIQSRNYIEKKYEPIISKFTKKYQRKILAISKMRIAQRCLRNGEKNRTRKYVIASLKVQFSVQAIGLFLATFVSYTTVLKIRGKFNY